MRKVTTVVPVLITSCQVSEKPKSGPVTAQTSTTPRARPKANGVPLSTDTRWASFLNLSFMTGLPGTTLLSLCPVERCRNVKDEGQGERIECTGYWSTRGIERMP